MSETIKLLVYSDNKEMRSAIMEAIGHRPGKGLPAVEWVQTASPLVALDEAKNTKFPVAVLDGEAAKASGMVVARTISDRLPQDHVPKFVITVARPQDEWLAEFSGAAKIVLEPLDPREVQQAVAQLLRQA
ncbi:MAG: two-component system response regulator [Actinomycetaceae bacterium]|nr:two-component system response regulator [Actinomycetaceae bacterium]